VAPQTKADVETVAKMLDIKRMVWFESTGIEITPAGPKKSNGRPHKNPKTNDFSAEVLRPFKLTGDGEEDVKVYIADAWPTAVGAVEDNARERREHQGQGPRVRVGRMAFNEKGEPQGVVFGLALHPRKKHWKRSDRRIANRIARAARNLNERRSRKPVTSRLKSGASRGPTPKGRSVRAQKEDS
jgi:hypothetical protein